MLAPPVWCAVMRGRVRADWIGLASATRSSNRCVAIFAISISAVACSWVGEFCSRSQPSEDLVDVLLVAHGHDQREAELLPVGLGQRRQLLVVLVVEPGQSQHRLVGLGVLALLTDGHRRRPEIRVGAMSSSCSSGLAANSASWKARRRSWVSLNGRRS